MPRWSRVWGQRLLGGIPRRLLLTADQVADQREEVVEGDEEPNQEGKEVGPVGGSDDHVVEMEEKAADACVSVDEARYPVYLARLGVTQEPKTDHQEPPHVYPRLDWRTRPCH